MSGEVNWIISFDTSIGPVATAEVYDLNGQLVQSRGVPCVPPVLCPVPMDGLSFHKYRAALRIGTNKYYYVQGAPEISTPNDEAGATIINLTESNPEASVTINVTSGS